MTEQEKYNKIYSYIKKAKNIGIYCHLNPDGDTVGSSMAMYLMLKKLGKNVSVFCIDEVSDKLKIIPYADVINKEKLENADLNIAIDVSDLDRIGKGLIKNFNKAKNTITIDHHKTNTKFSDFTLYEPTSATCEIVFKLIEFIDKSLIDDDIAKAIICGIITDSGAFAFSSTTAETHRIVKDIYSYNVDISDCIYKLIRATKFDTFKLKARVMANAKFYSDNQIAIISFRKEDFKQTNTTSENTEGIISDLIAIDCVKFAVAVTEDHDKYFKVSFRTKAPYDASDCAMAFGGGGHSRASGCRVSGFYEDVIEKLLKVCNDRL